MKTFDETFTEMLSVKASAPVPLLVFHFPAGDVYVSDRTVTPAGGPELSGLVTSWGGLISSSQSLFSVPIPEMEIELADFGPTPFSSYIEDASGAIVEAELFLWFMDTAYSGKARLGKLTVSHVEMTAGAVRLRLTGVLPGKDSVVGDPIGRDSWPGADPDSIGHIENIVYGRAKGVPCRAVDAGAVSTLVSDITAAQTAGIELSMPANWLDFPHSGTVQAGLEKVSYTGTSGRALTGVTRGAYGTASAGHRKGAAVFEVKPAYTYLVAGHPVPVER